MDTASYRAELNNPYAVPKLFKKLHWVSVVDNGSSSVSYSYSVSPVTKLPGILVFDYLSGMFALTGFNSSTSASTYDIRELFKQMNIYLRSNGLTVDTPPNTYSSMRILECVPPRGTFVPRPGYVDSRSAVINNQDLEDICKKLPSITSKWRKGYGGSYNKEIWYTFDERGKPMCATTVPASGPASGFADLYADGFYGGSLNTEYGNAQCNTTADIKELTDSLGLPEDLNASHAVFANLSRIRCLTSETWKTSDGDTNWCLANERMDEYNEYKKMQALASSKQSYKGTYETYFRNEASDSESAIRLNYSSDIALYQRDVTLSTARYDRYALYFVGADGIGCDEVYSRIAEFNDVKTVGDGFRLPFLISIYAAPEAQCNWLKAEIVRYETLRDDEIALQEDEIAILYEDVNELALLEMHEIHESDWANSPMTDPLVKEILDQESRELAAIMENLKYYTEDKKTREEEVALVLAELEKEASIDLTTIPLIGELIQAGIDFKDDPSWETFGELAHGVSKTIFPVQTAVEDLVVTVIDLVAGQQDHKNDFITDILTDVAAGDSFEVTVSNMVDDVIKDLGPQLATKLKQFGLWDDGDAFSVEGIDFTHYPNIAAIKYSGKIHNFDPIDFGYNVNLTNQTVQHYINKWYSGLTRYRGRTGYAASLQLLKDLASNSVMGNRNRAIATRFESRLTIIFTHAFGHNYYPAGKRMEMNAELYEELTAEVAGSDRLFRVISDSVSHDKSFAKYVAAYITDGSGVGVMVLNRNQIAHNDVFINAYIEELGHLINDRRCLLWADMATTACSFAIGDEGARFKDITTMPLHGTEQTELGYDFSSNALSLPHYNEVTYQHGQLGDGTIVTVKRFSDFVVGFTRAGKKGNATFSVSVGATVGVADPEFQFLSDNITGKVAFTMPKITQKGNPFRTVESCIGKDDEYTCLCESAGDVECNVPTTWLTFALVDDLSLSASKGPITVGGSLARLHGLSFPLQKPSDHAGWVFKGTHALYVKSIALGADLGVSIPVVGLFGQPLGIAFSMYVPIYNNYTELGLIIAADVGSNILGCLTGVLIAGITDQEAQSITFCHAGAMAVEFVTSLAEVASYPNIGYSIDLYAYVSFDLGINSNTDYKLSKLNSGRASNYKIKGRLPGTAVVEGIELNRISPTVEGGINDAITAPAAEAAAPKSFKARLGFSVAAKASIYRSWINAASRGVNVDINNEDEVEHPPLSDAGIAGSAFD